jgi:hypothetical protein
VVAAAAGSASEVWVLSAVWAAATASISRCCSDSGGGGVHGEETVGDRGQM